MCVYNNSWNILTHICLTKRNTVSCGRWDDPKAIKANNSFRLIVHLIGLWISYRTSLLAYNTFFRVSHKELELTSTVYVHLCLLLFSCVNKIFCLWFFMGSTLIATTDDKMIALRTCQELCSSISVMPSHHHRLAFIPYGFGSDNV